RFTRLKINMVWCGDRITVHSHDKLLFIDWNLLYIARNQFKFCRNQPIDGLIQDSLNYHFRTFSDHNVGLIPGDLRLIIMDGNGRRKRVCRVEKSKSFINTSYAQIKAFGTFSKFIIQNDYLNVTKGSTRRDSQLALMLKIILTRVCSVSGRYLPRFKRCHNPLDRRAEQVHWHISN